MNATRRLTAQRLAALVLAALLANTASGTDVTGKPAPDFTLKSTRGSNVRLAELRGDVVMLNFWATWCGPCRQEMPLLEKLSQEYRDYGFTLVGINVEEDPSGMDKFLKDVPVSFTILRDGENKVAKLYGVDGMPSTVIIDRNGVVQFVHRGYKPGDEQKYAAQVKQRVME